MPSVLITGANRGLGLEFAKQYAEQRLSRLCDRARSTRRRASLPRSLRAAPTSACTRSRSPTSAASAGWPRSSRRAHRHPAQQRRRHGAQATAPGRARLRGHARHAAHQHHRAAAGRRGLCRARGAKRAQADRRHHAAAWAASRQQRRLLRLSREQGRAEHVVSQPRARPEEPRHHRLRHQSWLGADRHGRSAGRRSRPRPASRPCARCSTR